ncbi:phosphoprotein [Meliandou mastomys virus]|uniref:Phosphoprotein n=1 Tax=Meliandou mastomys virus TaxID=2940987 RepID=A0AAE9HU37_9MONO|nr:phosphoprotein [Meliandou mastomys virus]
MTSYTTSELKKLVQDGMETIEFIQQNKEDIQKTYGRSAIEKPSTKERTVAWEKFTKDKNLRGEMGTRGLGSNQGGKEEGGKPNAEDSRQDRGRGTAEGSDHGSNSSGETIQPINLTNYPHNCERNRPNTGHEKVDDAKPGCSFSGGTEDNSGGHSASYITTSDYNQILNFDEETNKVETDPSHQTTMTIRDATADDLGLVLTGEPGNVHKRLRGITSSTLEPINEAGPSSGIKKGTDGNTASTRSEEKCMSENGATQCVQRSPQPQSNKNASAENARGSVQTVSKTGSSTKDTQTTQDYTSIEEKVELLLSKFNQIEKKVSLLPEIKEEFKNINKKLTNLSIAVATVENYIKDMMIIIPKSGSLENNSQADTNPDLRPIIGRDQTRGLDEIAEKKSTLESFDSGFTPAYEVKKEMLIYDLDFAKSNASNFVPENTWESLRIMKDMVDDSLKNKKMATKIKKWLEAQLSEQNPKDVYNALIESLNDLKAAGH